MLNSKTVMLCLISSSLLVGCYPMEQAPLVYSSKVQMGVHLSGGTTDTPGVELSIGYKDFDIAMVPVAVAKHCTSSTKADCIDTIYRMQTVLGGRENSTDDGSINSQIERYEKEELDAIEKEKQLSEQRLKISKKLLDFARWTKLDNDSQNQGLSAEERLEKAQERDKIGNFDGFNEAAETDKLAQINTDLIGVRSTIKAANEGSQRLTQSLQVTQRLARNDALSVFGSFDGDANVETGERSKVEGGLAVGKIFATGVAAQVLADAQQLIAQSRKVSLAKDCILAMEASAEKVEANGDKPGADELRTSIPKIC